MGRNLRKKLYPYSAALLFAVLLFSLCTGCGRITELREQIPAGQETGKILAVTWFGSSSPAAFWSNEHPEAAEEFRMLREEGFNTVILLLPWRQFQAEGGSFREESFVLLESLMAEAGNAGLSVMLRLGYLWDYAEAESPVPRFHRLVYEETAKREFLSYAAEVSRRVSDAENFRGAFLTWEDFWNFVSYAESFAGTEDTSLAEQSGYSAWVSERYTREELTALYGEDPGETPQFPSSSVPACRLLQEFYDSVLMELLEETQKVFPGCSLECRLDSDPVVNMDGSMELYSHEATFGCGSAEQSCCMLAVSMGFPENTQIPALTAAEGSRQLLLRMAEGGGKPVFADQFLYMETTPGYESAPYVAAEEMETYLATMGDVFREYSTGYGLWTWKDYTDDLVAGGSFAGLESWETEGTVILSAEDNTAETVSSGDSGDSGGNHTVSLLPGASISQSLAGRGFAGTENTKAEFEVTGAETFPVTLRVTVGSLSETAAVAEPGTVLVEFDRQEGGSVRLENLSESPGSVTVDNLRVYSHITEGRLHTRSGEAGMYLPGILELNRRLAQ